MLATRRVGVEEKEEELAANAHGYMDEGGVYDLGSKGNVGGPGQLRHVDFDC